MLQRCAADLIPSTRVSLLLDGIACAGGSSATTGEAFGRPRLGRHFCEIGCIEEIFGWLKTVGGLRKIRFIGQAKTQMAAFLSGAAYNLLRIAKLTEAGATP